MDDFQKTKEQLIAELQELRSKIQPGDSGAPTDDSIRDEHEINHDLLFTQMHLGVVYQDAGGRIISANPAAEKILGVSSARLQEETSMNTTWNIIHEDGTVFPGSEHPAMIVMKTGTPVLDVVMGIPQPGSDNYRWLTVNAFPEYHSGEEKPYQVCVTFDDITDRKSVERALRTSEERYRNLFDDLPVSVWEEDLSNMKTRVEQLRASGISNFREYFDKNNDMLLDVVMLAKIRNVNQATLDMYEADSKKSFIKNMADIITDETFDAFKEALIALEQGDTWFETETRTLTLKGSPLNILVRWFLPVAYADSWSRIIITMIDVSDRRKAENALRQSEATLRAFFNSVNDSALLVDLDDIVLAINEGAAKRLGDTPENLIGHDTRKYVPPDVYEARRARGKEVIRTRKPVRFQDERNGMYFDNTIYPVFNENGDVTATAVFSRDITEQKKAENALRESEATLRAFFNAIPDTALLVDMDGIILDCNNVTAEKIGVSLEQLIGNSTKEHLPPHIYDTRIARIREVFRTGESVHFQDEWGGRLFDHFFCPVFDENKEVSAVAIFTRDITEQKNAERALRKSEKKFRLLAENAQDMIFRMSIPYGVYEYVSPASTRLLGYSPEEMYDRPKYIQKIIHPDFAEYFEMEWHNLLKGDMSPAYDYKIIHKSGEIRWLYQRNVLITDDTGNPVAIEGIVSDVTVNREYEEKLKEYKHLFDNIELGIAIDKTSGKVMGDMNSAFAKMHGYTVEEMQGLPVSTVNASEDMENIDKHIKIAFQPGHHTFESLHIRKDGTVFPALVNITTMQDDKGGISYRAITVQDITTLKEAETAIRKSMEEYRSITNLTGEIISHADAEGKWVFLSDGACEFWGKPRDELLGVHFMEYVHPEDQERTLSSIREITETGDMLKGFVNRQKTPRGWRTVEWNAIPEFDGQGKYTGLKTTGRDITERMYLEEQLRIRERMDSLGTLAGGIAHDFNNLLAGIMGNIELLRMDADQLTPFQKESIEEAYLSSQRAAKLIRDFQGLTAKTISNPTSVDIYKITDEVFSILERTTDRIITKQNNIEPTKFYVNGLPDQLHQVLLNLGTNAVQAIEEKGASPGDYVRISAEEIARSDIEYSGLEEGDYIHMIFEDTGAGMSEEVKKKIFEPLFTTKSRGIQKGQGLGLAMVYNIIVYNHRGYISVDSKKGEGTIFHLYLPKSDSPELSDTAEILDIPGGHETILLIEDEDAIKKMVGRALELYGYTVLFASDGLEGVEVYKEKADGIDLVLLDLTMPKRSGIDVLEDIRAINQDAKVIISTGRSEEEIKRNTEASGYAPKPYKINDLMRLLRKVIDE